MRLVANLRVFRAIAEDAAAEVKRLQDGERAAGSGGITVVQRDPQQRSFKHSLIALAFAGSYLEALLRVVATERLGRECYAKLDRQKWENKLKALGVKDEGVIARCERFRKARNEVMHEEPLDLEAQTSRVPLVVAQAECEPAIELVREIARLLGEP
jgi:hypothetical protein